jgi:hypothetical protein
MLLAVLLLLIGSLASDVAAVILTAAPTSVMTFRIVAEAIAAVVLGRSVVQQARSAARPRMPSAPPGWGAYVGTKYLYAKAMTRGEYNAYRGWSLPHREEGTEAGYLVEYSDGGKANDSRHMGYISWSPAEVFNRTYRPAA